MFFSHEELEDYLSEDESRRVLKTIIGWGRYAEIFDYDYNSGVLMIPEEEEVQPPAAGSPNVAV